ncbi:unnamed protein product [Euphydryas editha]|uniref:Mitochondrial processing peptidase beta subunit n=1 Tax=Euphydryas editha TaxID=104508 RepID=A0AAU9UU93_EUPED|nr:unnamed protein product [Euphydryas editha]
MEELTNGVKIITEEVCSPLTCTSLIIQTGSRFENSCNNGISNFIEHVAMSKIDLHESFYNKGIKIDSLTTREFQRYSAICQTEYACDCLEAFSNIITDPEWNDSDIELQKNIIKSEAIDYDNNPKSLVFDYLHQTAFQETPLAQSVIGPSTNLLNFNKFHMCKFLKETYQPHRIVIVSCGGESHSSIMSKASSTIGYLPVSECKTINDGFQRYTGSQITYRDDSMPYAHIAVAVEVPGVNSTDYLTLLVANCLLESWDRTQGGTNRHASPLARAASTSRLCELFETFYIPYRDVGLWGVYFIGDPKYLDEMVSNIQDQWMHMCTTIVHSDVERAINIAKLKLARRIDGLVNSCYDTGLQVLYTSKRKSLSDLYNELSKVSEKTIKGVCFKYLYDKCPVVAAIGPTETLPHYNRIRSGMYWLRL